MADAPVRTSDAILTIPNMLTFARLALTPVFLWVGLDADRLGAAALLAVAGVGSDLLDGKIARRYGQISRLGTLLDPLSDRLALAAFAVLLVVHRLAPLPAIGAVVARDVVLVVIGATYLKARGVEIPPVSRLGKYGSFAISVCFALYLASGIADVRDQTFALVIGGNVLLAIGLPLYYLAGACYVREGLRALSRA